MTAMMMVMITILSLFLNSSLIYSADIPRSHEDIIVGGTTGKRSAKNNLGLWPDLTDDKNLPLEARELALRPKLNISRPPLSNSGAFTSTNGPFDSIATPSVDLRMTASPILSSNAGKYSPAARMALRNSSSSKDFDALIREAVGVNCDEFDDRLASLDSDLFIEDFENEKKKDKKDEEEEELEDDDNDKDEDDDDDKEVLMDSKDEFKP